MGTAPLFYSTKYTGFVRRPLDGFDFVHGNALNEWGRDAIVCVGFVCRLDASSCQLLRVYPCAIVGTDFIRTAAHRIMHSTVVQYSTTLTERIVLTILITLSLTITCRTSSADLLQSYLFA